MIALRVVRRCLGAAMFSLLLTASPCRAQTDYFWNAPTGGNGDWDLITQNWAIGSGGPVNYTWMNSGLERANFGNSPGTVPVLGAINAYGLNFTTDGYTINGNEAASLTVTSSFIDTGPGVTSTIFVDLAGSNGLTKVGTGTLIVGKLTSVVGAIAINEGTLRIPVINALPSGSAVTIAGGATLDLNNTNQTIGSLQGAGNLLLGPNSGNIATIGGNNGSTTFSGVISGDGILTKVGTGTMILTGNNTYAGNTVVNGGTLLINGQSGTNSGTGTSNMFINSGGTFGGNGRVDNDIAVQSGGAFRAGDEDLVGTMTIDGVLSLATGSTLGIRLSDASPTPSGTPGGSTIGTLPNPTSNNFIHITNGGLTIPSVGATITVDATGTPFVPGQSYSYQVALVAGQDLEGFINVTDQAMFTPIGFSDPFIFSLTGNSSGAVFLNISPVPEPATVLGLAAGALGVGGYVRRRVVRRA